MQKMVNSLAFQAHRLAFDGNYMSPFSKRARENGINALGKVFYIDILKQTKIYCIFLAHVIWYGHIKI